MDHEKDQNPFPFSTEPAGPPAERRTGRTERRVGPRERRTEIRYGRRYGRKQDRRVNFLKDRRSPA
jgi:hypothetical protein